MIERQNWRAVDGDNTLALDWPDLDENSIVWEIGGFKGRWALQMAEKFNPHLYIFEPQDWAVEKIREKLEGYNAQVHHFALWTHNGEMQMNDYGRDGASLLKPDEPEPHIISAVDIYPFFVGIPPRDSIRQIDVCLMNIEGGEFVLLPYMIGMGMMRHIKYFWCQWHLFVEDSQTKWDQLRRVMDETHEPYWDCGGTAQAWRRRD